MNVWKRRKDIWDSEGLLKESKACLQSTVTGDWVSCYKLKLNKGKNALCQWYIGTVKKIMASGEGFGLELMKGSKIRLFFLHMM